MSFYDKILQFETALEKLKEAVNLYNIEKKDIYIDAMIQRFEFCTELSWKLMKRYLDENLVIEHNSPRSVVKEAYKQRLIEDGEIWLDILEDRNLTSHTYDELTANRIRDNIINKYLEVFDKFLNKIKEM